MIGSVGTLLSHKGRGTGSLFNGLSIVVRNELGCKLRSLCSLLWTWPTIFVVWILPGSWQHSQKPRRSACLTKYMFRDAHRLFKEPDRSGRQDRRQKQVPPGACTSFPMCPHLSSLNVMKVLELSMWDSCWQLRDPIYSRCQSHSDEV